MQRTWIGRNYKTFLVAGALGLPLICSTLGSYVVFGSFSGLFQSDDAWGGLVAMVCILLILPGGYLGHKVWKTLLRTCGTAQEIEVDDFLSRPIELPTIKPLTHCKISMLAYGTLVAQGPLLLEQVCSIVMVCLVWGFILCLPWMLPLFSQETDVVLTTVLVALGILLCCSVPSETLVIDRTQRNAVIYTKKVLWWTTEHTFSMDVLEGVRLKEFTEYRLGGTMERRTVCVILIFSVDALPEVGVFHTKGKEEHKAVAFLRRVEENLSIPATTSL